MDYVIFNEVHRFYHEKKKLRKSYPCQVLRQEGSHENKSSKEKIPLSPQPQRYLGAWNVTG